MLDKHIINVVMHKVERKDIPQTKFKQIQRFTVGIQ